MNNHGSFTLEASIVMIIMIIFITVIISFMILFFNRGINEGYLNAKSIANPREEAFIRESVKLTIQGTDKNMTLYNQSVSNDFLKSLVIEDYIIQGRRWLDE